MELKVTRWAVDGPVGVVTLARPERLNAWTGRMAEELKHCLTVALDEPAVRCVVITGEGRGFCAGADMQGLDRMAGSGTYDDGRRGDPLPRPGLGASGSGPFAHDFSWLLGLPVPVVAAINGPAAGVGFVLACFCDRRIAAAGAKLTTSFGRLGLPAEHGVSWLLPRLVGVASAADLLYTSRVVLAEEAAVIGLVDEVVAPDEVLGRAVAWGRAVAEVSPTAVATMKRQLWADLERGLDAAAGDAERLVAEHVAGADFAEGVRAFEERRPPAWAPAALTEEDVP